MAIQKKSCIIEWCDKPRRTSLAKYCNAHRVAVESNGGVLPDHLRPEPKFYDNFGNEVPRPCATDGCFERAASIWVEYCDRCRQKAERGTLHPKPAVAAEGAAELVEDVQRRYGGMIRGFAKEWLAVCVAGEQPWTRGLSVDDVVQEMFMFWLEYPAGLRDVKGADHVKRAAFDGFRSARFRLGYDPIIGVEDGAQDLPHRVAYSDLAGMMGDDSGLSVADGWSVFQPKAPRS